MEFTGVVCALCIVAWICIGLSFKQMLLLQQRKNSGPWSQAVMKSVLDICISVNTIGHKEILVYKHT